MHSFIRSLSDRAFLAALSITPNKAENPFAPTDPRSTISDFFNAIMPTLAKLIGIVALGYIVYAGFRYITAGGDIKKAQDARTALLNAVIGVVIVIAAYFILNFGIAIAQRINDGVAS